MIKKCVIWFPSPNGEDTYSMNGKEITMLREPGVSVP